MSERRAWTLPTAAGLAALEVTVVIGVLAARGGRSAPLAIGMLAMKYPFCLIVLRRAHGAWFGLLLWEFAGMLAAVTAPRTPLPARLAEFAVAFTVAGLLVAASPLFPSVKLPPHEQ